jgi:hypothetical protein
MTDTPKILLAHHLKALKLPTFLREYDKLARQCASKGQDYVQFLTRLVELELIDRERRMIERRIKAAKFPTVNSLDSFDFKTIPSLNKMQVLELARCKWVDRRDNVIALGPSGTGKTHVALGLGLAACQKGMSVGFTTTAALVHELMEARDERRLLRLQKEIAGYKLRPAGLRGRAAATVPSDHRRTRLCPPQQNRMTTMFCPLPVSTQPRPETTVFVHPILYRGFLSRLTGSDANEAAIGVSSDRQGKADVDDRCGLRLFRPVGGLWATRLTPAVLAVFVRTGGSTGLAWASPG